MGCSGSYAGFLSSHTSHYNLILILSSNPLPVNDSQDGLRSYCILRGQRLCLGVQLLQHFRPF